MSRGGSTLKDWLAILSRRWRVTVAVCLVSLSSMVTGKYFFGARYEGEAVLNPSSNGLLAPVLSKLVDHPAAGTMVAPEEVRHLFESPAMAAAVHAALAQDAALKDEFTSPQAVASALSMEPLPDGRFRVRASGASPAAAVGLAALAGRTLDARISERIVGNFDTVMAGVSRQHAQASEGLKTAHTELGSLREQFGLRPEDTDVEQALGRLHGEKAALRRTRDQQTQAAEALEQALKAADPTALARTAPEDPRISDLLTRRRLAKDTLDQLRVKYEDEYDEVKRALKELARLDEALAAVRRTVCEEAAAAARAGAARADASIRETDARLAGVGGPDRVKLAGLFLNASRQADHVVHLARTLTELQLERDVVRQHQEGLATAGARPIHAWSGSLLPFLVASALLGLAAAHGREALDESVRDPAHVSSHARLDVLATIPTITEEDINLADVERPSGHAEVYSRMAMVLSQRLAMIPAKILSITSASPEEGKSTVASNLAVALARLGKKTILIDADLRNPRQHDYFRVDNRAGLSSLLERKESARAFLDGLEREAGGPPAAAAGGLLIGDLRALEKMGGEPEAPKPPPSADVPDLPEEEILRVIADTEVENLKLVPAGPGASNSGALLESPWFDALLMFLKDRFTYIVIDTPPVRGCADALIVGKKSGATLLVVRAGLARREDLRGTRRFLADAGATLVGAVLNCNGDREVAYSAWERAA